MRRALDRVFGEQLLQIGTWGSHDTFLKYARTQRAAVLDFDEDSTESDLVCQSGQLPIASDSIDAVLLRRSRRITP